MASSACAAAFNLPMLPGNPCGIPIHTSARASSGCTTTKPVDVRSVADFCIASFSPVTNIVAAVPLASPLYSQLAGMPPISIHVGDDEVLLDDSLRYVERAVAASVDARADVWMGMPHGFPASIGRLKAAAQALDAIGAFLAERLTAHAARRASY